MNLWVNKALEMIGAWNVGSGVGVDEGTVDGAKLEDGPSDGENVLVGIIVGNSVGFVEFKVAVESLEGEKVLLSGVVGSAVGTEETNLGSPKMTNQTKILEISVLSPCFRLSFLFPFIGIDL